METLMAARANHAARERERLKGRPLTRREREVLKMLAEGNSVKEIACDLNLSVKTVEIFKFNLMRKLDVRKVVLLVKANDRIAFCEAQTRLLEDGWEALKKELPC
jgi:DNA-binding NarL/FixJ family response regulator